MVPFYFDIGIKKRVLVEFLTLFLFFFYRELSFNGVQASFWSIGPFCNVNNVSMSHDSAWVSLNDCVAKCGAYKQGCFVLLIYYFIYFLKLKYNSSVILCQFQVYNIVIPYVCILQNDHHEFVTFKTDICLPSEIFRTSNK